MRWPALICALLLVGATMGFKVLIISPKFGYSHMTFMGSFADLLADAGHSVTLFQPKVMMHLEGKHVVANKNVKVVDYEPDDEGRVYAESRGSSGFSDAWVGEESLFRMLNLSKLLGEDFIYMCKKMFRDTELHEKLRSEKYDVIISEPFDFCGLYLADYLGNSTVLPAFSGVRMGASMRAIGQPTYPQVLPGPLSKYPGAISDRFKNLFMHEFFDSIFASLFEDQYVYVSEIVGGKVRHWKDILNDAPFNFVNGNPYLDFPVPNLAKVVQIGGFTVPKKSDKELALPAEFEKMLSERSSTVLVSFGSVVRSADMPLAFKNSWIQVFLAMPETTFIWKYEEDGADLGKLPDNVHLSKWVPQKSLLDDDRLSVFVTHGGLGSTMEVAYNGKPCLLIPIFADQPINAEMLARHGGAIKLVKEDLNDWSKVKNALQKMINDKKYLKNARRLSEILRNPPHEPREVALRHVEFAARFGKLPNLDTATRHLNFFQYYFLDVFSLIAIATGISLFIAYRVLSFLATCLGLRREKLKTQ